MPGLQLVRQTLNLFGVEAGLDQVYGKTPGHTADQPANQRAGPQSDDRPDAGQRQCAKLRQSKSRHGCAQRAAGDTAFVWRKVVAQNYNLAVFGAGDNGSVNKVEIPNLLNVV